METLATEMGIPRLLLEQWQRDGEPSVSQAQKIAEFFSRALKYEIYEYQLLMRDLSSDPFFNDVLF